MSHGDIWMRLELNGEVQDFPVTGVGGTTRVAVGKVGRRSSIWRIWANKSTSDVYVAARTVAGEQKFSLHESGDWRYAWTSKAAETLGDALPSRVKDRWRRGDPDEIGWTPALSIWVRSEDVPEMPDDTKSEEVRWVERPPVGWVVGIHLLFIQPELGGRALIGFRIGDVLRLANGHGLMVMTGARPITSQEVDHIAEGRRRAFAEVPEIVARPGEPGLRVAIFGYTDDGHRTVWDTALDPHEEVSTPNVRCAGACPSLGPLDPVGRHGASTGTFGAHQGHTRTLTDARRRTPLRSCFPQVTSLCRGF